MQPSMISAERRTRRGNLRLLAASLLSFLLLAAGLHSTPVLAHAMLVKAEPARRAQLTQVPAQVRLFFNEEVEKDYASLAVLDAAKAMRLAHPSGTGRCPAGDHPGRGLSLFGGQVRLCGELALEPSASRPGADTRLGQFESVSARSSR